MQTPAKTCVASVSASTLKNWLHLKEQKELAVLDVREHGQYGEAHLFFGVNVPYSRLEKEIFRLVPNLNTRIVVYDHNDGVAQKALNRLDYLGYKNTHYLEGGAQAWEAAGFHLFAGVNLPSKTFGELVEHKLNTPRISAQELQQRLDKKDNLVVLDGRPLSEYHKMNIPTASCCPNGELALRVHQFAPDPSTTVVINCAGRTRSIIGAQTLLNFGIENPVVALENGTQGWYLNDLQLEHGASRTYTDSIDQQRLEQLQKQARQLAEKMDVNYINAQTFNTWLADNTRNTFLFDIRSPEEFAAGSLPGAVHAAGGQLIQATDLYVGVQGARIVVFDGEGVRAPVIASWLVQMGWEAVVLDEGINASVHSKEKSDFQLNVAKEIDIDTFIEFMRQDNSVLLDVRPSMAYRKSHIRGAQWAIRPRLQNLQSQLSGKDIILVTSDKFVGQLAALDLQEQNPKSKVYLHIGKPEEWATAGLQLEETPDYPADEECIDYLFFVHDRHDGNKQAARQYLAWETNLLNQVDEQELKRFSVV